jgi:hypothetical protein
MKHHIKTISTAGILSILAWSPVVLNGQPAQKESTTPAATTSESSALISKDSHPSEVLIAERLLTASPEQLARARTTIEKIEKMSEDEKKAALEAIRKTMDERRRAMRNLSPEEREKLRNLSPEERQKLRNERPGPQRGPREDAEQGGRRGPGGPGPRGPQADRAERPDRPERPRRERPAQGDAQQTEKPAANKQ